MRSTFNTSRIFNDQDGWYIVIRASDEQFLTASKHKLIGDQHLMGPFNSKRQTEDWFEGYLAMHSEKRSADNFIPDSIDSYHYSISPRHKKRPMISHRPFY